MEIMINLLPVIKLNLFPEIMLNYTSGDQAKPISRDHAKLTTSGDQAKPIAKHHAKLDTYGEHDKPVSISKHLLKGLQHFDSHSMKN
jgi:hypothetical protein